MRHGCTDVSQTMTIYYTMAFHVLVDPDYRNETVNALI